MKEILIRNSRQGDAGYVAYMHGRLYKDVYGLCGTVEYYFMKTLTEFVHKPAGGALWVAESDGVIVGSVGVVRRGKKTAQLRWFLVDGNYQNKGIGKRLIDTALDFCREQSYKNVFLWTFKGLEPARHLYERAGFMLTEEKPNLEWSKQEITEQKMVLNL